METNAGSFMAVGGQGRLIADLNELALSTQRAGGANPIALLNLADIVAKDLQSRLLSGKAPGAPSPLSDIENMLKGQKPDETEKRRNDVVRPGN
jgi:hypothetical protein